jgi:hypothetical protein
MIRFKMMPEDTETESMNQSRVWEGGRVKGLALFVVVLTMLVTFFVNSAHRGDPGTPVNLSPRKAERDGGQDQFDAAVTWLAFVAGRGEIGSDEIPPQFATVLRENPGEFRRLLETTEDLLLRRLIVDRAVREVAAKDIRPVLECFGAGKLSEIYLTSDLRDIIAKACVENLRSPDLPSLFGSLDQSLRSNLEGLVASEMVNAVKSDNPGGFYPGGQLTGNDEFDFPIIKQLLTSGVVPETKAAFLDWIQKGSAETENIVASRFAQHDPEEALKVLNDGSEGLSALGYRSLVLGIAQSEPEKVMFEISRDEKELRGKVLQYWLGNNSLAATEWIHSQNESHPEEYRQHCLKVSAWLHNQGDLEGAEVWKQYSE